MRTSILVSVLALSAFSGPPNSVNVSGKNTAGFFPFDGTERS